MADTSIASTLKQIGRDPGLSALRPPGVTGKPPRPGGLPTGISGPPPVGVPIGPVPRYPRIGLPSYGRMMP